MNTRAAKRSCALAAMLAVWLGPFASVADEPPDLPASELVKRGREATCPS